MDVESLAKQLILQNMTPEQQKAVLESVRATLQEARGKQKQRVSENVGMVVDALKKIEADIRAKYDDLGNKITARVNSIRDGRDGTNGTDGRDGQDGRPGRDGAPGPAGPAGRDGTNGIDGKDGVSVIDAKIDFDGSLIISLSNGREINVGEVVAADVAEKIRVLTYGGGNSGGGGTSGLTYEGTWNASTNTPTLISSSGTNGDYYIVSVAGTTDLNGITDWQPGDWVIFNGTAWQKIDQSWATAGVNNNITAMTGITGGISSPDFVQFDTGATVTNAAGRLYWDDMQKTLTVGLNANISADIGQTLYAYATNDEAVTINKGQPVYMFSAQGDRVSVKLAYNTGDATSAKTLGVCAENIAAGQAGMILCQGVQDGLDLSAYTAGDTLYLGATAGTLTNTKPYAPNHLVYIGVVERANAGNGRLYVRVQNGYEMDELHNVSAQSPSNGQVLIYNASTSLWEKNTLTDGTGITITEGAGSITIANSGVTGLTGTANQVTVSASTGSVTLSLPATINVNTSGTASNVTGTVAISNGGSGETTAQAAINAFAGATTSGRYLRGNGTNVVMSAIQAADVPTLNQNTTGTAAGLSATLVATSGGTGQSSYTVGDLLFASTTTALSKLADVATGSALISGGVGVAPSYGKIGLTTHVSGTLPVANGGSGETTAQAAMNAFAGAVTSGRYLRGNGTNVVMATIQAADVPTLNQNTTGSAGSVTGNATGSTFGFNSGYGSVATAYGCRAWVSFNGTGTVSIRGSGNVSSITDNGTGDYTMNFTTAMPDANYAWAGSAKPMAAVNAWVVGDPTNGNAPTTSALRFKVSQGNFTNYDADYVTMIVFR